MSGLSEALAETAWGVLRRADAAMNRLYGWRYNPLYQSGALTLVLLAVVTVTGLYLLIFYRIGEPYESVARITDQAWAGRWIRSLHRYASDAAVVAIAVHAFRMFAQRRSWGARTLAWVSGVVLLGIVLVLGWTGYVMVWDVQAHALAVEGARLLDALPIFSEPLVRTFAAGEPPSGQFFFLNLFLHIAVPIGLGLALWIHVSRLARPVLVPPRRLWVAVVGALVAVSVLWPISMAAQADPLRLPREIPIDLFYSFWLPAARALPAWATWAIGAAATAILLAVPLWARPARQRRGAASSVDERLCTGCVQCSLDCPYEAIEMLERSDGRAELVARVEPARCTSCGICAGSCAPMGVGPPERTGRDQLRRIREGLGSEEGPAAGEVVVVACGRGLGAGIESIDGAPVHRVSCAGTVHTSVVEHLLRADARGVLVLACPPRDCWNREGPRWTEQRLFHDREAELHDRVEKRRVRFAFIAGGDLRTARVELGAFRTALASLERGEPLAGVDAVRECDPAEPKEVIRS
ncbi:MAG: hydrogenase iron-sulfur subunit [Gemmatimonadota bacterium]|nr:hydrogenase iron-sulfur subunit [Gemmatimonadota bacterium]